MNLSNFNNFYLGTFIAPIVGPGNNFRPSGKGQMQKIRVLLADDDDNFARILKKELEEEDFIIDLASNGVEAVMNAINQAYDFLLMDLRMPRLSGIDALKIIKKLAPNTPCIAFSGNAGPGERAEFVECGAMKCLEKPFAISGLKEQIKDYFRKEKAIPASPSPLRGEDMKKLA